MAMILGNPVMMDAYRAGIPGNGKPVPDGAKMAKVHWRPKPNAFFPETTGPGDLLNVDFMLKDSARFADSGG
jgi:cytochrome P460